MEYQFNAIEQKWQKLWKDKQTYKVSNQSDKLKYYVLDMFPYPSGAGLHVGHPLGYIASDICSRYKRLKGFNVLHPMGFDSFGLPAEQYAIETGQHPATTTERNIATFKSQLDKIGFCYDWDREVRTSDPSYYKWTQWIFLELFSSYFDITANKAQKIEDLVALFAAEGSGIYENNHAAFTKEQWSSFTNAEQEEILMQYRLAFSKYGEVNWCEALGTVLANDEVVNGLSERGGHPVEKKKMRQWYLRITAYADRLLQGLDTVDFSESMKDMQRNWIGKSEGANIRFNIKNSVETVTVYTTRPDTIFGVDFLVLAPELELIKDISNAAEWPKVQEYIAYVKSRSDVERMAEKKITGCFTGAYAMNPFSGKQIPIWISEYVLAGYGTGAIMAVPCGDERDFNFAKHFDIAITNIIGNAFDGSAANSTKDAVLDATSDFLAAVPMREAAKIVIEKLSAQGIGARKINYRMRDAGFSRQRYWGEPFPITWNGGVAVAMEQIQLPLELPHVDKYSPGPDGLGPLANIVDWVGADVKRETSTMPGYAGSSWYFLRYMDPHNTSKFCDRAASDYWNQVDLYIGGTEHAVGHLLYSRLWTKVLFDLGHIGFDEPFRKLLNQGMIQGSSRFVYRIVGTNTFVSAGLKDKYETNALHVDVNIVDGADLDINAFKEWKPDFTNATFELENGKYICGVETEKMSKSKYNTVNPNVLCDKYGADTFRMYEMFLGPVEASKPWDTKGIEGVHRFLKKLWRLFFDEIKGAVWNSDKATEAELKILHKTIKKIEEDTARFSFNTAVSNFMICVNELADAKCHKKEVLEQLLILLAPYAPHIAEELYEQLGYTTSILDATYPVLKQALLVETSKEYPVSINGKLRTNIALSLDLDQAAVEQAVLGNEVIQKWLEGATPKKIIFVKGRMINVVV